MALALCLSCIPARPPASPNREHYVSCLLQSLPASLQQLATQHTAQLSSKQVHSINAAAARGLRHARTLMMFMQSWRDSQHSEQPLQQGAHPAAQAFVSCWPLVEQALSSAATSDAVKDRTAACCTAAVRVHLPSSLPVLPGILQTAAGAVASGSSSAHLWTAPLAAALDQLEGEQLSHVSKALLAALTMIDTSAPVQSLVDRAAADQNPDFAVVSTLLLDAPVHAQFGASSYMHVLNTNLVLFNAECSEPCHCCSKECCQATSHDGCKQQRSTAGQQSVQSSSLCGMLSQRHCFYQPIMCIICIG